MRDYTMKAVYLDKGQPTLLHVCAPTAIDAVYMTDLGGIGFVGADRDNCEVNRMEHILHWGDQA